MKNIVLLGATGSIGQSALNVLRQNSDSFNLLGIAFNNRLNDSSLLDDKISLEPTNVGEKTVMVDSINHALSEELAFNEKMVIYGQDVAGGKGGGRPDFAQAGGALVNKLEEAIESAKKRILQ